jgi:hypothetical protein
LLHLTSTASFSVVSVFMQSCRITDVSLDTIVLDRSMAATTTSISARTLINFGVELLPPTRQTPRAH